MERQLTALDRFEGPSSATFVTAPANFRTDELGRNEHAETPDARDRA